MLGQNTQHLLADISALLPLVVSNALSAIGAIVIPLAHRYLAVELSQAYPTANRAGSRVERI